MSNKLADLQGASNTTAHAGAVVIPVPPAAPPDSVGLQSMLFAGWAVASLIVASLMGLFKHDSIRGPERLRGDESVWWLMMILCGGALVGGKLATLFQQVDFNLPADARSLLVSGIGEVIVFAAIVILSVCFRKDAIRLLGLHVFQLPVGLLGGVVTLLMLFPMVCLTETLVTEIYIRFNLKQANPHELLQLMDATHDRRVMVIAFVTAAVVAPLLEELIFRGMIQTMLGRMFSFAFGTQMPEQEMAVMSFDVAPATVESKGIPGLQTQPQTKPMLGAPPIGHRARWAAVVMTSALFAAIHVEPAFMPPIFILSLGLGYVYERTGNLWMNITAHSLFNSVQILLFFLLHQ